MITTKQLTEPIGLKGTFFLPCQGCHLKITGQIIDTKARFGSVRLLFHAAGGGTIWIGDRNFWPDAK